MPKSNRKSHANRADCSHIKRVANGREPPITDRTVKSKYDVRSKWPQLAKLGLINRTKQPTALRTAYRDGPFMVRPIPRTLLPAIFGLTQVNFTTTDNPGWYAYRYEDDSKVLAAFRQIIALRESQNRISVNERRQWQTDIAILRDQV